MKKSIKVILTLFSAILLLASCSSMKKMLTQAENVVVECQPKVLEVVNNKIDATISVTYPEKYFHPKAILEVTPVIVYQNGEVKGDVLKYQGEKVRDNNKVVPRRGGTITEHISFNYVNGMENCYLELRAVAKYKNKSLALPIRKVADGANTTYMLIEKGDNLGIVNFKADNYQEIIRQTEEGQLKYRVNSANVGNKAIKSASIQEFLNNLDKIKKDERKTIVGTEVIAYASPEGKEDLNSKLSEKRSKSADKFWNKITKNKDISKPQVKALGEDWEGFHDLVEKSNLEDKDLIIRVLSMYSDPAVRESEIKNLSEVYTALKGEVLPELRRARFIANIEYKNYTPEELISLVNENADILDEEALLRVATLVKDSNKKISIYEKAIERFNSDRAKFNLGVTYLNLNKYHKAEKCFKQVATQDAELDNALAVVYLRMKKYHKAINLLKNIDSKEAKINLGSAYILKGKYKKAVKILKGTDTKQEALALILTNQLSKADQVLNGKDCPMSSYLKAIVAARQGEVRLAKELLKKADKDHFFAKRSYKDIEFTNIRKPNLYR